MQVSGFLASYSKGKKEEGLTQIWKSSMIIWRKAVEQVIEGCTVRTDRTDSRPMDEDVQGSRVTALGSLFMGPERRGAT